MDRRAFISTAIGILGAPLAAGAQQPTKVARIGYLTGGGRAADLPVPTLESFRKGLGELGWIEGRNLIVEYRFAEERLERLPDLAVELVRLKVDVILAGGGPAPLKAARDATKTIPIVMVASSSDPVGQGLIQSFARPGGNITGLVIAPEPLVGKRLELLKETLPGLSRVGLLGDATIPSTSLREPTEEAARSLRVELRHFDVRKPTDLDSAVSAAAKARVGALLVLGTPMFVQHRGRIAELLGKHRLPAISLWRSLAEAGFLMTYGPSLTEQFRRAATYVDKILKGAKPADLPVEQPTKFELVINLKTAKALGLTIPPSILVRADEIIE